MFIYTYRLTAIFLCGINPTFTNFFFTWLQIERYMRNTHAKTHSCYTVDIEQIFKVTREGEIERFGKVSPFKYSRTFVIYHYHKRSYELFSSACLCGVILIPWAFVQFSSVKNRMLLWHGSRLTNWAGILSQGYPSSVLSSSPFLYLLLYFF